MKNTTQNTVVTFTDITKTLATLDERFTLYDDASTYSTAYCSVRLILKDKTVDTRRIFCIYMNAKSVTIHCAKRFETFCSANEYHLNKKMTEYTKTLKLDELSEHVKQLLTLECERLKMTKYTERKATATERKAKQDKAK